MMYNTQYYKYHWKGLHDQAGHMRDVIKLTKSSGLELPLPPHNAQKDACPSYHINVLCNVR